MPDALIWWAAIEVVGLATLPIAFTFFQRLPDRGYSLAKVMGLLLLTYGLWLSALLRVLPNTRLSILMLLLAIAAGSLVVLGRRRREFLHYLRDGWRTILLMEALFLALFAFAAYYYSFIPDIGEGEEPMDFAYLNSILRSRYFPPGDPWLSGHSIPYYYFGHLVVAVLTKLTGVAPSIAFNLGAAMTAALAATAAFGIAYNLAARSASRAKAVGCGLVGVLFLIVLSNLDGVFELMSIHGVGSSGFYRLVGISGLEGTRPSAAWYPTDYWWWGRAQVLSGPWDSHQFPFAGALLGGIHADFVSLPFILLVVGIALNLGLADDTLDHRFAWRRPLAFLFIALAVGALLFVDSWAFPAFAALVVGMVFVRNYLLAGRLDLAVLARSSAFAALLLLAAAILVLPYLMDAPRGNAGPRLVEVAFIPGWPRVSAATRPNHLFLYFLPLLWVPVSFLAYALSRYSPWRPGWRQLGLALLAPLIPLVIWAAGVLLHHQPDGFLDEIRARDSTLVTMIILVALVTAASLALVRTLRQPPADGSAVPLVFAVLAAGLGVYLILGPELFWIKVKDAWQNRTPTTFRLSLHAWILLSIAAAYGLFFLASTWRPRRWLARLGASAWALGTLAVVVAGLVYPVLAVAARTDAFGRGRTLDGLALVKRFEPSEYAAIQWLNDNVTGTPVILEAPGPEYGPYARVSVRTGLPTVLGWPSHEYKFRGSLAPQAGRQEDMDSLYRTLSADEAERLIDKYDIQYVYVGALEKQEYSQASLEKFARFMAVAYSNGDATIYRTSSP